MRLIFGGVRGTAAAPHAGFLEYGGETTAALVEGDNGERILIDAGTGVRALGGRIERENGHPHVLLLLTHYHLDHVIGLPSLGLLYRKGATVTVGAPARGGRVAADSVRTLMSEPFWPVQLEELRATIRFLDWTTPESAVAHREQGLEIRWCPVHHPGGCTAYRIDERGTGRSLVFATDVEWPLATQPEQRAFMRLCSVPSRPDVLVFDGQFGRNDYAPFRGWGHSTWEDAADVARETGARRLLVTHHAPQNDDRILARVDYEVGIALPGGRLAREAMEVAI
jgi:ribonuclease BN (tRNA processing enzyme)